MGFGPTSFRENALFQVTLSAQNTSAEITAMRYRALREPSAPQFWYNVGTYLMRGAARCLAHRDLRHTQSNCRTGQPGRRNNAGEVFENVSRGAKRFAA